MHKIVRKKKRKKKKKGNEPVPKECGSKIKVSKIVYIYFFAILKGTTVLYRYNATQRIGLALVKGDGAGIDGGMTIMAGKESVLRATLTFESLQVVVETYVTVHVANRMNSTG